MKPLIFTGAATAMVTPMHDDFSINYGLFGQLLDEQVANKADAVVVAGTTGESATLTDEEHINLISYAVHRIKGRIPVIAGAGSNNTAHAVWLSRQAERAGADALLHVTPYYNKAPQEGLFLHFKACAEATALPVILYNVPSRTGVNISPATYGRLSHIENIVAAKEASGNFSQLAKIAGLCGSRLAIYTGNDDQITSALALGAQGVVSVLSHLVPEGTHNLCTAFFDGDAAKSDALQLHYLELIEALFSDINPIPVKQALRFMGWDVGPCRLPLCGMEPAAAEHLQSVLAKYGLCPLPSHMGTRTSKRPEAMLLPRNSH
ncbi:4-hydroxy-tetrahydrodipicolinate synthase [Intestinibacillus massiliensis]